MSIIRQHHHDKGFVIIDNRTARDRRLSFKASGILAHLLSLPDGAPCSAEALAAQRNEDGVRAIRAGFTELEEAGYMERIRCQGEKGRWTTEIHVYERPEGAEDDADRRAETASRSDLHEQEKPQVAPTSGLPTVGEPPTKDVKTPIPKTQPKDEELSRDRFEEFWTIYPKRVAKATARRAWTKRIAKGADPDVLIDGAVRYAQWCLDGGVESPQFIAYPATWLNAEREQDQLPDVSQMARGRGRGSVGDAWDVIRRRLDEAGRVGVDQQGPVLSLPGQRVG